MDVTEHLNLVIFKDRVNEAAWSHVGVVAIGAGLSLSKEFSEGSR